ncbi:hypothetical protein NQD34_010211, partial [Periophthalmus magnuspinnatus]
MNLKWFWYHRNFFIIILTPILLLPLPLVVPTKEAKCGYAIILMALYWCTECLPLAVTALLPVVLFPMMNIMEAGQVSIEYLKDSNMLFIGGLLVAIAVENWNLHKRIALRVLLLVGVRPSLLMLGFMIVSSFLSMWISNTATTAMMLPIAHAVLQQLRATEARADDMEDLGRGDDNAAVYWLNVFDAYVHVISDSVFSDETVRQAQRDARSREREARYDLLTKGMSLSVCYSASIGGTATLTGTTPNLILQGQMNQLYPDNGGIINFASWFGFSFPNMVLMLIFSYVWLQFMFLGFNLKKSFGCGEKSERDREACAVMREEYRKLGPMSFAEIMVLVIFVLLVVLWFTREPGFIPGWATVSALFFRYVSDGTVAILMSMLFFVVPSQLPSFGGYGFNEAGVLCFYSQIRMPWNIILLLGGGFALAKGSEVSGLSTWLGESLAPLEKIPPFAISLLLCLLVATFTECSSNTATTTLFLPILGSMATAIKIHPLYIMLPCTIAASLAFMLPVATPPNAIAFSFGNLKVLDMTWTTEGLHRQITEDIFSLLSVIKLFVVSVFPQVKAGFMLNIIGILCINLGINTWGYAMFDMGTFPTWANVTN